MSGVVAGAGRDVVGPDYEDSSGRRYLPMLVQPVLVFEAGAGKLRTVYERAMARELSFAIYTRELFETGKDEDTAARSLQWRARISTWWDSPSGRRTGQRTAYSEG